MDLFQPAEKSHSYETRSKIYGNFKGRTIIFLLRGGGGVSLFGKPAHNFFSNLKRFFSFNSCEQFFTKKFMVYAVLT